MCLGLFLENSAIVKCRVLYLATILNNVMISGFFYVVGSLDSSSVNNQIFISLQCLELLSVALTGNSKTKLSINRDNRNTCIYIGLCFTFNICFWFLI